MRVLHIIDSGRALTREFARPRTNLGFDDRLLCCRCIRESSLVKHDHRVCLLGGKAALRRALELGLPPDHLITPPLFRAGLAVGPVGRLIRAVRPDMVHWWDGRWTGGCVGRPGRAWRLESVIGATPLHLPLWLSSPVAMACGPVERSAGVAAGFRTVEVEAPAFPPPGPRKSRGDAVQVLALGPQADARKFVFLCSLMGRIGVPACAVVPASADLRRRMRNFYSSLDRPLLVRTSPDSFVENLKACDIALWAGGSAGPSAVGVRSALAAGVPAIVPPEGAWVIPEAFREDLVARNATPGELARLVQLHAEQPGWGVRRLAGFARLTNDAFINRIMDVYDDRPARQEVGLPLPFEPSPVATRVSA